MARTFKALHGDDVVNTRTLLHEAIPITGTISSGTYIELGTHAGAGTDLNVKAFSHGMFESVYDYPFLSSSANHIYDLTFGLSSEQSQSSAHTQQAKKLNIYNQMAQTLVGYDVSGNIKNFYANGSEGIVDIGGDDAGSTPRPWYMATGTEETTGRMDEVFFMNVSRLLVKDEIKKNSFRLQLFNSGSVSGSGEARGGLITLGDYLSANQFRTSPAGDYGLLFTGSGVTAEETYQSAGLIFYQAGVVVLTSSIFRGEFSTPADRPGLSPTQLTGGAAPYAGGSAVVGDPATGSCVSKYQTGSSIEKLSDAFRHTIYDVDFNNTIELNSAIYFCRVNHNDFNYSSNPTYVNSSKLRVKNNVNDLPISYITTVGLYSPDNELLAVAKLSEPIRKDPNTELTLRVRLDY